MIKANNVDLLQRMITNNEKSCCFHKLLKNKKNVKVKN